MSTLETFRDAFEIAKVTNDKKPLLTQLHLEFLDSLKHLVENVERFLEDDVKEIARAICEVRDDDSRITRSEGLQTHTNFAVWRFRDKYDDLVIDLPLDYIYLPDAVDRERLRVAEARARDLKNYEENERARRLKEYRELRPRFDELRQEFGDFSVEALEAGNANDANDERLK